jgi:hypothetical protein
MEPILPGQFLFEFVGEICTNAEMIQRNYSRKSSISYSVQLDADWQEEVISSMVVTRTFSDGRTDDRTMAAGASVTWTHCSVLFEVTWG